MIGDRRDCRGTLDRQEPDGVDRHDQNQNVGYFRLREGRPQVESIRVSGSGAR